MKKTSSILLGLILAIPPLARSQPSVVGQWGTTQTHPFVSVHTCLLPNNKVIFWDYSGNTRIWDPVTTAITTPPQPGRNTFCSGNGHFADGKIFVPGGHIQNNVGLASASYYDPVANTWTSVPNMNAGRWYPSTTTLANGDMLVTSGDDNHSVNDLPQVFEVANGGWRNLTSARLGLPLYPRTFLAPNGRVFFATSTSRYLDTSGAGAWSTVGNTVFAGRDNYGSACMDQNGRVFWFGGGDAPTASCERIDLNAGNPQWTAIASMSQARRHNNVTILPDGKFLVTGGSASSGFNTEDGPKAAYMYDPVANSFATMATESDYRGYHSCAVLLADGRVLSSGGDNHPNGQVFSPPYLFNGARPTISSAPATVNYGETFFVGTPDGAGITRVTWTRLGALTHAQNWDQRFNVLTSAQVAGGLNVTAPSGANSTPPGHYLLWILNGSGVPSEGRFVRIGGGTPPPPTPPAAPSNLTASSPRKKVIDIAWTDNSANETGFKIERGTDGVNFAQIATVNVNVTTYRNTGLAAGTRYYYRVRATNGAGDSAYSNTANAVAR